jgi:hypothetical protein
MFYVSSVLCTWQSSEDASHVLLLKILFISSLFFLVVNAQGSEDAGCVFSLIICSKEFFLKLKDVKKFF